MSRQIGARTGVTRSRTGVQIFGCARKSRNVVPDSVVLGSEYRIRALGTESVFDQGLETPHYVAAYVALKKYFGIRYAGFVDIWKYTRFVLRSPRSMEHFKKVNRSGMDCINFLGMRVSPTERHTAACLYRPFTATVTIFEPQIDSDEIHRDYVETITRYHGPNVKIEYCHGFPHQVDDFSCSLHALWACICVLANADPSEYNISVMETFKIAKMLIESPKKAKMMSIKDILNVVATKK